METHHPLIVHERQPDSKLALFCLAQVKYVAQASGFRCVPLAADRKQSRKAEHFPSHLRK